jgi:glycosyltransferase involved in cell wall biosynthesis
VSPESPETPSTDAPLEVVHFFRMPNPALGYFSVERLFDAVISRLPASIRSRRSEARFHSRGLLPRLYIMLEAFARRGAVNHVTGDVHFLSMLLPRRSTIVTVLDLETVHRSTGLRRLLKLWLLYELPLRRCRYITAISEGTAQDLASMTSVSRARIRVIPACTPPGFRRHAREFRSVSPRVLMVGTKPNKNLERSIEALRGCRCEIRLIGKPSREQLDLLRACGTPWSSADSLTDQEMIREYQECDLLLFASTFEGFGMPIVEAQTIGRPVITSDRSPMREVAGGGALLVDPESTRSIRDGIDRMISDSKLRERLLARGSENARLYSAESIAAEYAALYLEVART